MCIRDRVSDIPGNREWIADTGAGWLFPDGDTDALAQALVDAVDARHSLPEVGKHARALAEERADWSRNVEKLIEAYDLAIKFGGKR